MAQLVVQQALAVLVAVGMLATASAADLMVWQILVAVVALAEEMALATRQAATADPAS